MSKTDERAPGQEQCEACREEHSERYMNCAGHGDEQLWLCDSCEQEFTEDTAVDVSETMDCDEWDELKNWIKAEHALAAATPKAPNTMTQAEHRAAGFDKEIKVARLAGPFPPEDPEAEDGMNEKRSGWAQEALRAYAIATGGELEVLIKDLIGDLGHFCDRHGIDLFEQWQDAAGMYAEETQRKGEQFDAK